MAGRLTAAGVSGDPWATRRIVILGGSFDPVHAGHLAIARQARAQLHAAETWYVPVARQPLRDLPGAAAEDRLAMLAAAVDPAQGELVLDLEIERGGTTHTVDTQRELSRRHPGAELWWVIGADTARGLPRWHRAAELLATARFAVVNRSGVPTVEWPELELVGLDRDRTRLLSVWSPPTSATAIRRAAAQGESLAGLVPRAVAEVIRSRRLYAGG